MLQTLRQPLESGEVVIARARQVVRYPARFLLVLAANPCPCGRSYGKGLDCSCKPMEIRSYAGRLSGPLLDRVDLQVHVPPVHRAAFGDATGRVQRRGRGPGRGRAAGAAATGGPSDGWATNGLVPGHVLRRAPFRLPADDHGRARPQPSSRAGSPCAATTGCCGSRGRRPTWPGSRCRAATRWPPGSRCAAVSWWRHERARPVAAQVATGAAGWSSTSAGRGSRGPSSPSRATPG